MAGGALDAGLEPGLTIDRIEERLVVAATRHHLEERNMAYWLLEIDQRLLYRERGFSSVGDYARELIGITPRKAQYLVFIADRLSSLPLIARAFDAGDISWTKAREIVRVATPETERQWLDKAKELTNRELEKEIRQREGRGSGGFATLTISLPVELLELWNDGYELAERLSGGELEKYQVLEPMLAEFIATYMASDCEHEASPHETDHEKGIPAEVRRAVLERDRYECVVPGCAMRKMLDPHHLEFRSHGGDHDASNLVSICRIHHALLHRGICKLTGRVGVDLRFERPRLFTEKTTEVETMLREDTRCAAETTAPLEVEVADGDTEDWREETVAAIFDGPPAPTPSRYDGSRDVWSEIVENEIARERRRRAFRRSRLMKKEAGRRALPDEHVFAAPLDASDRGRRRETGTDRSPTPPGGLTS